MCCQLKRMFAIAILIALVGVTKSDAAKEVPLKILGRVAACTPEQCPEAFALLPQVEPPTTPAMPVLFADQGRATHFGNFRTVYAGYLFPDGSFVGTFVLTAADGSQIKGNNSGRFAAPGMPGSFVADFQGGTKRFKHAKAHAEGQIFSVAEGVADYRGEGDIDLDTRR